MDFVCLDFEGVLAPEIWIAIAEKTGIPELRVTTREIADYDVLMKMRLGILDKNKLTMPAFQPVLQSIEPLPGARDFLDWLRPRFQVVILSDTFYEFVGPVLSKLGWPTMFCHRLETDAAGKITDYKPRMPDHKRAAATALKALNFRVSAVGDSFNDTGMFSVADNAFFFRAPENVTKQFPQYPRVESYEELKTALTEAAAKRNAK